MATVDTSFEATGPASAGFLADGDFTTGVHGVGRLNQGEVDLRVTGVIGSTGPDAIFDSGGVGVLGRTDSGIGVAGTSSANTQTGAPPGVGVRGLAGNGNGVEGESTDGGTGVLGKGRVGVQGEAPPGSGVGVFGTGRIGVQGAADIGVLGGPPQGTLFESGPPILAGVAGTAPGDVKHGDIPSAYGGWFDALNGTAPLHLEPSTDNAPPPTALRGDFFVDNAGRLWFCVIANTASTDATWKQVQLL
jgi:hypothetical protein